MKKSQFSVVTFLIIALGLSLVFVGCDKVEVDNQKPMIRLIEPADDEVVMPGEVLHLKMELSDNVALASYKVNIHGAFDGHSHNSGTRSATDSIAFERTWLETDFIAHGETPIVGKQQVTVEHQHIKIPATISRTVNGVAEEMPLKEGHYHFIVYCTDESGQESYVAKEIFISYSADGHSH